MCSCDYQSVKAKDKKETEREEGIRDIYRERRRRKEGEREGLTRDVHKETISDKYINRQMPSIMYIHEVQNEFRLFICSIFYPVTRDGVQVSLFVYKHEMPNLNAVQSGIGRILGCPQVRFPGPF